MSYEVPMMFLEMVAHYYGKAGIDNDGDGLIDEDPYGDADGDGVIDDDGDCLSLNASSQDSNGDGTPVAPVTMVWTKIFQNSGLPTLSIPERFTYPNAQCRWVDIS